MIWLFRWSSDVLFSIVAQTSEVSENFGGRELLRQTSEVSEDLGGRSIILTSEVFRNLGGLSHHKRAPSAILQNRQQALRQMLEGYRV